MTKTLKDYILEGGIKGRKFAGSDDDYAVLDIEDNSQKGEESYLIVKYRAGEMARISMSDVIRTHLDAPERKY